MSVDFYWTLDADLAYGGNGDIRDTSFDIFRSLWQEIRTRCRSAFKDWALYPTLGADLDELLGRMNNRMTAEEGRTRLFSALTMGGFLPRSAIKIRYLPIARHQLTYSIVVAVRNPATGQTKMLTTQLVYDTDENKLSVV